VQYLTHPVEVLRDIGRVLRPGAPLIITFSNRCFQTKATACWRMLDDDGHVKLLHHFIEESGRFRGINCCGAQVMSDGDPLYGMVAYRADQES
jgi:hypothetical protein